MIHQPAQDRALPIRQPKVLHVIPSVATLRGGPSQAVLQMVRQLRQQQIPAEIVTTNDNGPDTLAVPLDRWTLDQGLPLRYFGRWTPPSRLPGAVGLREFAFSRDLTLWLWHHMRDYDLVHIHALFSYPCLAAMAIARSQGVPYILRPLGSLCHWSLTQNPRQKQAYLRLTRPLLDRAVLHFTSKAEAEEVASLQLRSPSFVLPLGLEMPSRPILPDPQRSRHPSDPVRNHVRQNLGCAPGQPLLLFLSRIHPKKGLDLLLQALADLNDRNSDHSTAGPCLAIAGSGDPAYVQALQDWAAERSLQPQLRWLGFVAGEQKQRLLQAADCFLLPSQSENFGIAVLEAMAAGLPVLTTPGVALAEQLLAENIGWVLPPSLDLWTAHLAWIEQQLRQDPEAFAGLGDRARQVAAQFSWPVLTERLIVQYQYHGQFASRSQPTSPGLQPAPSPHPIPQA